ncbi:MAG: hypothetical protein V3T39_08440 [Gammaproteobacteria bacterium]
MAISHAKILVAAALGVYLFLPSLVAAQAVCGERQRFIDTLRKQHQEAPTSIGMTSNGQIIEVLTSAKGTWSIIITSPGGKTCLVATGDSWEAVERTLVKPEAGI